jgi:hypothetical protein
VKDLKRSMQAWNPVKGQFEALPAR